MSTVYGFVKVKETDEPIAGLMVVVASRVVPKTTAKTKSGVSDPFQLYKTRLGSTITDAEGRFQIEFENEAATSPSKLPEQTEQILALLAPATTSPINKLTSTSPFDKLLYWVMLPRLRPDQSEACTIRLTDDQLKNFNIPTRSYRQKVDVDSQIAYLAEAEKESEQFRKAFQKDIAPLRKKRLEREQKIVADARQFASSLYATPKAVRTQRTFGLSKDQLKIARKNAVEYGLANMKNSASKGKGTVSINLDQKNLDSLGIGNISGGILIETEKLCQLMSERRGGTELTRVRGLLDAYKVAAEATARLARDTGSITDDDGTVATEPSEREAAPADTIAQHVLGQLKDMPVYTSADDNTLPKALTRDELNAMLPAVQLGAGPTDVPSFHDFYNLQMAFLHVWTEAFDEELRSDVEKVYEEYVKLHHELYGDESFTGIPELEEIQDLIGFIRESGSRDPLQPILSSDQTKAVLQSLGYTTEIIQFLSIEQQTDLNNLASLWGSIYINNPDDSRVRTAIERIKNILEHPSGIRTRLERLLYQVSRRLNEPYSFHYFEPDSVNFGILLTYRQHWQPGPYQVGDLVSTIPLAPGEKRRFETKQTIRQTRAKNELVKAVLSKSFDSSNTLRADAEITERASIRSNFQMTAEGSLNFGIGELSSTTQFGIDQNQESSRVKKDFREAVLKAAQEYRQERSVEVRTTDEITTETTTSGELSNPNNELTVTYLLYELERQYTISEQIHRVTPVILVAQDMPAPHEITESWLLAQQWILRRVLLDDSLRPALEYVSNAFAGEEVSIEVSKATWEKQNALVTELEGVVKGFKKARDELRELLITTEEARATEAAEAPTTGQTIWTAILTGGLSLAAGDSGSEQDAERLEIARRAIESRLKYLEDTLKEAQERMVSAQQTLNEATRVYKEALETQTNRRVAIDQLRIHVKENIFYYMQAIWDYEPPDQRFFRLYHVNVDLPESPARTVSIRPATEDDLETGIPTVEYGGVRYIIQMEAPAMPDPEHPNPKPLVEIADLDHPLGYKGNYIIFPLKTCLYLTNFMMREFFDDYFGVRDPEVAANFTVEELLTYAEALIRDGKLTGQQRAALQGIVMTRLRQPRRDSDLVVVPTGELFMEALLGEHVLLENFKLNHRYVDMAKARAEWRGVELENLRRAARLLKEEPDLEDPDVDKRIVVEGPGQLNVDVP